MNILKFLIGLSLAMVLISPAGTALAHRPEGMQPPPPMSHMMGPSGIGADKQYLYVMAGGKIMQYGATDLKLVKTVDLPKPASQSHVPPRAMEPGHAPPKTMEPGHASPRGMEPGHLPPFTGPMAGPRGLLASEGSVYVWAGSAIYRYSTPDLKLQATAELPKPELPKPEQPQAGN